MCQAEAWSQFFCNLQIAFSNYYASNTNPQSVSSYSLRVLKSLHEIFRAPFLIIGLKHCQSSSPAWRNSQQKHSRETCFLKTLPTTKNSSLQVTTVCGLPKQVQAQLGPSPTQEKHAPTSFLPLLLNYLTVSNLPSATNFTTPLLHTTTQGSRTSTNEWAKQHALRNKTARTIKGFLDLSFGAVCGQWPPVGLCLSCPFGGSRYAQWANYAPFGSSSSLAGSLSPPRGTPLRF